MPRRPVIACFALAVPGLLAACAGGRATEEVAPAATEQQEQREQPQEPRGGSTAMVDQPPSSTTSTTSTATTAPPSSTTTAPPRRTPSTTTTSTTAPPRTTTTAAPDRRAAGARPAAPSSRRRSAPRPRSERASTRPTPRPEVPPTTSPSRPRPTSPPPTSPPPTTPRPGQPPPTTTPPTTAPPTTAPPTTVPPTTPPTTVEPPDRAEPGAPRRIRAQRAVDEAAALVLDAVEAAGPRTPAGGFAGVVVDPAHLRMSVYWKGDLPVAVANAVARAGARVEVVVRPAAFTRAYLLERAQVVVDDRPPAVHRVSVLPTGAGLGVEVSPDGRTDEAALESALGVPVELVISDAPEELRRPANGPPWPGGARLTGRDTCTAGFGVRSLDSVSHGLLTAGHCDGDARGEFRNGRRLVGPDEGVADPTLDSKLVPDRAAARIRSGRHVRGQRSNVAGDEVCMSGAGTGAHCGMRIVNVDAFVRPAGATAFTKVVVAEGTAGPGDSGGPVFTIAGDGGVEARGTVSAGAATEVYFVDIGRALDAHHAELLT